MKKSFRQGDPRTIISIFTYIIEYHTMTMTDIPLICLRNDIECSRKDDIQLIHLCYE